QRTAHWIPLRWTSSPATLTNSVSMAHLPGGTPPGDVEERTILLRVFPHRGGQQSRVRIDVRARLQNGLAGTSVRRPRTRRHLRRHWTRPCLSSHAIFIIPGAARRHV